MEGEKKKANNILKRMIKALNESETIKIYENSMNSSQSFKAGLHKPQHTSLGTSFNENGRVYAFIHTASMAAGSRRGLFTHVRRKQKARPV